MHQVKSGKQILEKLPWKMMSSEVGKALEQLLEGRKTLRNAYREHLKNKASNKTTTEMTFSLDGRLVGDIGELIAAEIFHLDLLGTKSKNVDAETSSGPKRRVQIKATFGEDGLSIKHGGDYFIGLQLNERARFRIIYNGPAKPIMDYLKAPSFEGKTGRTHAETRLEAISLEAWAILNLAVTDEERIPLRAESI